MLSGKHQFKGLGDLRDYLFDLAHLGLCVEPQKEQTEGETENQDGLHNEG